MATITPTAVDSAGETVTFAAASAGGDTIATAGYSKVVLIVRNASGGAITCNLAGALPCSQGVTHSPLLAKSCAVGDTQITVPAATINPTTGNVAVTYSSATSVTVAAVAP